MTDIGKQIFRASALYLTVLLSLSTTVSANTVWLTDLNAEVTSGQVERLVQDLEAAERASAELVILRIDTPGGMLEPTRVLIQAILDSPVPVVGYVAPAGARASSAGTYILAATHVAAMAPATNVGSAKPVFIGFGEIDEDSKLKATNDASAQMRALAQLRNRNAEWLEQSVVAAKNITAEEALGLGVIDLIAVNQNDLLKQLQGRQIQMGEAQVILETEGLAVKESTPFESLSWATIWLLFGIALIALELALTSFISLFFGLGALITAICLTLGLPPTGWPVWTVFLGSSIVLLFGARARFKQYFVGDEFAEGDSELDAGLLGQRVQYVSGFTSEEPGEGVVQFRGSNWQARSDEVVLSADAQLEIVNFKSNTLWIKEITHG
ncbi:MAG: NfeD family protein [Pseudomonadales bacterium]|jgi:membrane-bound ClpP family serine protease|tara:strand:+ start:4764 stop:5912 length:1149 start_codon:yes stop_codon:yes gene_type:complete